jgi:hypothetical protein
MPDPTPPPATIDPSVVVVHRTVVTVAAMTVAVMLKRPGFGALSVTCERDRRPPL